MKQKSGKLVLGIAAAGALLTQQAQAVLIFADSFNYTVGSDLNGQGGWTADNAKTDLTAGLAGSAALTLLPNGDNIASHALSPSITGTFYTSTLIRFTGTVNQNDFGAGWFNNQPGLGFGVKGNQDSPSGVSDLFARLTLGEAAYGQDITPGVTYQLVAKFGHDGAKYNNVTLWVNPVNQASPSVSTTGNGGNPTINAIHFRTANLGANENVTFDNLRIGTEWIDVVPVPEPATFIAGALLLLPFGASTLRIRKKA